MSMDMDHEKGLYVRTWIQEFPPPPPRPVKKTDSVIALVLVGRPIFTLKRVSLSKKLALPQVLCKPHYGNSHLETVVCKWGAPHYEVV